MRQRLLFAITVVAMPLVGAFLACGAPSSFEHLVGPPLPEAGADTANGPPASDPTLKPPRQLGPLSASYIDSLRPHFRWQLLPETIGANVDVCDKPDCSGIKKTYAAAGSELTLGEDLPPGRWFWRIASTTATSFGQTESPAWLLLVRGGQGNGEPRGAIVDINGDGNADLIGTAIAGTSGSVLAVLGNDPNDPTSFALDQTSYEGSDAFLTSTAPTYAATDVDGDGLSDMILSDTFKSATSPSQPYLELINGSSGKNDFGFSENPGVPPPLPPLDVQATIASGGDLDGDGYGDLVVSQRTYAFALYGTTSGFSVTTFFDNIDPNPPPDAGEIAPTANPIAIYGFDQDVDGITDVAESSSYVFTPFYVLKGGPNHDLEDTSITINNAPPVDRALAFTSGDIDADGKPDVAFLTNVAAKPSICVLLGKIDPSKGTVTCWTPPAPGSGFGSALVAADLDADGKDEVLVGTASGGVDILTMPADALVAEHLAIPHGAGLTVLFPGRPGPAVWAASQQNGATLAIYRAKDQARLLTPPLGWTSFGTAIR